MPFLGYHGIQMHPDGRESLSALLFFAHFSLTTKYLDYILMP